MENETSPKNPGERRHTGGCHCGVVRFAVTLDVAETASRCNCSICTMTAGTTRIVKPAAFELTGGQESLSSYEWGGKIAQRYFCKHCGIHTFARGFLEQVGGDYVSVTLNCLDDFDPNGVPVAHWDGRHNNWQAGPRSTPWPVAAATPTA